MTATGWFVGVIAVLSIVAIGYLIWFGNDDSPLGQCLKANPGYHCQSVWIRGAAK